VNTTHCTTTPNVEKGRVQRGNSEEENNGYVVCKLNIYGSAGEEDRGEGGGGDT
jgi:hypothetical protein